MLIMIVLFLLMVPAALGIYCDSNEFECFNKKQCVYKHQWCDLRTNNCEDYSDENYCRSDSTCSYISHFKCDSGACIPAKGECDGYPSCPDGSDELDCPCEEQEIQEEFGSISFSVHVGKKRSSKCWKIEVPPTKYLSLDLTELNLLGRGCNDAYLMVTGEKSSSESHKFCPGGDSKLTERFLFQDIEIRYRGNPRTVYDTNAFDSFAIRFTVADVLCRRFDSIKCTHTSCVPPEKKCDGHSDCLNGADEQGCERGVSAVPGVNVTRNKGIKWLKEQRNAAWGWRDNTHRAIVALYLAQGANFNSTHQEEDLMAKQLELQMTTAILRNETDPITPTQLAMYIDALLVICHDPRNFYGFDLIRILQDQMELPTNAYHPLPYLALCNANESLTDGAVTKLSSLLESSSEHSFLTDVQSVAVIALSCISKNKRFSFLNTSLSDVSERFKKEQKKDGSFGNIYTTALVIQALLSNGNEEDKDWDLKAAIEFLQQKQSKVNGSFEDFLSTYLILPILNAKSLADIGKINCSESLRMPRDGNPVSDIELRLGQKMSIKYCLYIGDQKDQMHPISLRTPANITVLDVMRLAAEADPKYRFEAQSSKEKLYIYKLSGISNDPEDGKFWLLYTKSINATLKLTSKSPDDIEVYDKDDIIMWYKSTGIE